MTTTRTGPVLHPTPGLNTWSIPFIRDPMYGYKIRMAPSLGWLSPQKHPTHVFLDAKCCIVNADAEPHPVFNDLIRGWKILDLRLAHIYSR